MLINSSLKWTFAKNEGGRDVGFHDAGVETFKGNFDQYLARELIQNSLDARAPNARAPVEVKFELLELDKGDIPDLKGLQKHFQPCAEFWSHDAKAVKFFKAAEALLRKTKVVALRVSDYNTTGVIGGDTERAKMWYNLIRCAGSSSKSGTEGGSFGLGKNAPFAASQIRTVLYSTLNVEGKSIFQGVAMLASHKIGSTLQPIGYLGGNKGASIRKKSEIPVAFRRTKLGTDVVILGFPAEEKWDDDLVYSVLDNFWPAIDSGDLTVTVGTQKINKKTLPTLLAQFSDEKEDFSAHLYYRTYKTGTRTDASLPNLGSVTLLLESGDVDLPKQVAMIRKTGMVIFHRQYRSLIPFSGVFICTGEDGNRCLRDMEPPRHDEWSPDLPTKGANKKIEAEYAKFIRECIKNLAPLDDSKVIALPELNRFLPDDDEGDEETFADSETKSEDETRSELPEKIPGKRIDRRGASVRPIVDDDDDEPSPRLRPGPSPNDHRDPEKPKVPIPIKYRTFSNSPGSLPSEYTVTIRADSLPSRPALISLWAVGDDQRTPVTVESAKIAGGKSLPSRGDGVLGPVSLPKDQALRFVVTLKEPERLAMEVSAHEA